MLQLPRKFSLGMLTTAETNIKMGTAYFADLVEAVRRSALRAGDLQRRPESRRALDCRRPGLDRDEFIDDIPFPETQNYVKQILGTRRGLPPPL